MASAGPAWAWESFASRPVGNGLVTPVMTGKPDSTIDPVLVAQPEEFVPGPTVGPAAGPTPELSAGPASETPEDDGVSESVPSGDIGVVTPATGVDDIPPAGEDDPGGESEVPAEDPQDADAGQGDPDEQFNQETDEAPQGEERPGSPGGEVVSPVGEEGEVRVPNPGDGGPINDRAAGAGDPAVQPAPMIQGGGCSLILIKHSHFDKKPSPKSINSEKSP